MAKQLRLLLDTNVLIPLQDSYAVLSDNLANLHRLAVAGGHQLLYHPATIADFERDPNAQRRARNLEHVRKYLALDAPPPCPWNTADTGPNDACDNEILYALKCNAVHVLVTEDRGLLSKARATGLGERTYSIQTAEEWLRRLQAEHPVVLPNIEDVPLFGLTPELATPFFDSLRRGYAGFDTWFSEKAQEGRRTWINRDDRGELGALCIYTVQTDERICDDQVVLPGKALKLCTFKVGEAVRGRKIGELFLKASFRYATDNACENIFIHANAADQAYLVDLLRDFGFEERGSYLGDQVFVKAHPVRTPGAADLSPLEFNRKYFPHFLSGPAIRKFMVPIKPGFHQILFPDYDALQSVLFGPPGSVGNAIKLAYLCKAATQQIRAGDLVLFYRTGDEQAVTSLGVVERFEVLGDAAQIASLVSRRTVYSMREIETMAAKPVKVILFRLVAHLPKTVAFDQLLAEAAVNGNIQSITQISDDAFSRVLAAAGR